MAVATKKSNSGDERLQHINEMQKSLEQILSELSNHDDNIHTGFKELYKLVDTSQNTVKSMDTSIKSAQNNILVLQSEAKAISNEPIPEVPKFPRLKLNPPPKMPILDLPNIPKKFAPIHITKFVRKEIDKPVLEDVLSSEKVRPKRPAGIDPGEWDMKWEDDSSDDEKQYYEPEIEEEIQEEDDEEEEIDDEELRIMIEEETPEKLLKTSTDDLPPEVQAILCDPVKYKLPKKQIGKVTLGREMRKLAKVMRTVPEEDRIYAKLTLLKHYDALLETFKRYCKIGGDSDWLTERGWDQLIEDSCVVARKATQCTSKDCATLFTTVFNKHHVARSAKKKAETHDRLQTLAFGAIAGAVTDTDPWSGTWLNVLEDGTVAEKYKLKHVGDNRIIGCIKSADFCEINGSLGSVDHSKAKLIVKWKQGPRCGQIRRYICSLILPDTPAGDIAVKVSWEGKESAQGTKSSGVFAMSKDEGLEDDIGLPQGVGLVRHEFFEAILKLSQMKFPDLLRFEAVDKFVVGYIVEYIWGCAETVEKKIKKRMLSKHATEMHALYFRYVEANDTGGADETGGMGEEEWITLSNDVMDCGGSKFSKGGRPNMSRILNCFKLSLRPLETEMNYQDFEKCMELLSQQCFRKQPKVKYVIYPHQEKFKMLLEWLKKLHKKNVTIAIKKK